MSGVQTEAEVVNVYSRTYCMRVRKYVEMACVVQLKVICALESEMSIVLQMEGIMEKSGSR
jgi:hypothetical protein